jgi:DNA-directed RNA polymerase beta subunit
MLPPCRDTCRQKCCEKLTDTNRQQINSTYWNLDFGQRRLWLDSHISVLQIKRRTRETHTRKKSLRFSLPKADASKQTVCKVMFLHTLGLKTDGIITEFVKAKSRSTSYLTTDKRAGRVVSNNQLKESIQSHINSYHPQVGHYNREHAPNRRYLDCNLTIKGLNLQCCAFSLFKTTTQRLLIFK